LTESEKLKAARAVAFRFLGYSARSCAEIERRLDRGGFDPSVTAVVVAELRQEGYLDDESFASDWIKDRADRKQYGRSRLKAELVQRGVDGETIQQAIGAVTAEDEFRRALEIALKKQPLTPLTTQGRDELLQADQKLAQMLHRRGFTWDIVKQVLALREENREELS